MITARLILTYESERDNTGSPPEEDLGEISLVAAPAVGEIILVLRRGQMEADVCRVSRVIHRAVPSPYEPSLMPSLDQQVPSLLIFAAYAPFAI